MKRIPLIGGAILSQSDVEELGQDILARVAAISTAEANLKAVMEINDRLANAIASLQCERTRAWGSYCERGNDLCQVCRVRADVIASIEDFA